MQREHFVPRENVIALPVRKQVGVFHRADSDDARDLAALGFGERRIFLRDDFQRALHGFVKQIGELDRLAAARFERLAVVA